MDKKIKGFDITYTGGHTEIEEIEKVFNRIYKTICKNRKKDIEDIVEEEGIYNIALALHIVNEAGFEAL